eukprot:scaffold3183_cov381-Prasinococcus_capsulatus_cf.AAC.29
MSIPVLSRTQRLAADGIARHPLDPPVGRVGAPVLLLLTAVAACVAALLAPCSAEPEWGDKACAANGPQSRTP